MPGMKSVIASARVEEGESRSSEESGDASDSHPSPRHRTIRHHAEDVSDDEDDPLIDVPPQIKPPNPKGDKPEDKRQRARSPRGRAKEDKHRKRKSSDIHDKHTKRRKSDKDRTESRRREMRPEEKPRDDKYSLERKKAASRDASQRMRDRTTGDRKAARKTRPQKESDSDTEKNMPASYGKQTANPKYNIDSRKSDRVTKETDPKFNMNETNDREDAREELRRIERRIAELKESGGGSTTASTYSSESTAHRPFEQTAKSKQSKAFMDAEVEDVSASESDSSSEREPPPAPPVPPPKHESPRAEIRDQSRTPTPSSSESEGEDAKPEQLVASKFDEDDDEEDVVTPPTSIEANESESTPSVTQPTADAKPDSTGSDLVPPVPAPKPHVEPERKPEALPVYYPALQGCRSVDEFRHLNRIEEGTYGVVYRARDLRTNEIVALKRLKMEKEREGFPITSLREINCLLKCQHENVVPVREIVVGSNMDKIYLVMDYVEHDLKSLMEVMKQPFLRGETKTIMLQLLRGIHHLHDNWILHRDLKASNLLFSHKGELKIGDFGLAREYGSPLKPYTPIVVTLWYRAPELLLGSKLYSKPVDMWSVGCIFGELLTQKPMFPGKSEVEQCNLIFKELGTPNEKIWPGYNELPMVKKIVFTEYPYNNLRKRFGALLSESGFELLNRFLAYSPSKRITAAEALDHDFFKEDPLPVHPSQFPTWPAKSEGGSGSGKPRAVSSPKAPEGGAAYNNLGNDDDDILGFQLTHASQGLAKRGPGFALKF